MKYLALTAVIALVALPAALAFGFGRQRHVMSCRRSNKLSTTHLLKMKGGRSSMPPLPNPTSTRGNIFKTLRRDVYPTVDLSFESGNYTMVDHYFMGMALEQARRAWKRGEVPIGAIIVRECNDEDGHYSAGDDAQPSRTKRTFQIISSAHNRVERDSDASAHAELLALRRGAQNLRNWRFPPGSRLYATLEPCPLCLASIQAFRIDHVVYGAPDNRLGAVETHMDLMSVAKHPYHQVKSVTGGVREEECGDIVVRFFRERRRKKKERKGGRIQSLKSSLRRGAAGDTEKKQSRFLSFLKALMRR